VIDPFQSETILQPEVVYHQQSVTLEMIRQSFAELDNIRFAYTPNQRAVAAALDVLSSHTPDHAALLYLDQRNLRQLPGDFDLIAPDELTSIFTISTSLANVQSANLQRRTDDIRHGSSGFSANGLAIQGTGPGYSGAIDLDPSKAGVSGDSKEMEQGKEEAAPPAEQKWGAFLTGTGEWVDVRGDGNGSGYDITTGGFTLGLDYRVSPGLAIGIAAGYVSTGADLTDKGRVWVNGGKLGVYATAFTGGWYTDLAVTGGYNSYDTRRASLDGDARGSTSGGELNVLAGAGYEWKRGPLQIGPTATFQYTRVSIDGFTEDGSLAPLRVAGQDVESIRSALGFKASWDWKTGGVPVRPELRASWQHEYGDTAYALRSSFATDGGNSFVVHGPDIGRDSLLFGVGVAVQCSERCAIYLYYDTELGRRNYESQSISGGVRLAF
jgi:outer membrane autotransporter protein